MADIHPFKAVRPTRDKAHLVATRPLTSYKKHILKAKLEDNPYTFIHIIHPEVDKTVRTRPNSRERFEAVRKRFYDFLHRGILFQDSVPTVYVYRQTKDGKQYTGFIAGASVKEYEDDLIKKHEATLTTREEMFTNYLDIVGFNAEPVLLSHQPSKEISDFLSKITGVRPEYEFSTVDLVKHELWVLTPEETQTAIRLFDGIPALYIADGHHRSASSARLAANLRGKTTHSNPEYFLAFLIDETELTILEFNRVVKSLRGLSEADFLKKLQAVCTVKPLTEGRKPLAEHEITMYLRGKWFSLDLQISDADKHDPVKSLDAQLLTDRILTPVLGISDLKTDRNISFVSGADGLEGIIKPIDAGTAEVGFVLYPVSMKQVKRVADNHLIMPPKSTWVEPKIRSGLTIYMINE